MTKNAEPSKLDHRVDLYTPSQCICGGELPQGLRNKVIEEVKSRFDSWFGNHSEIAIKGDWRLPDGTIAKEEVADIYALCAAEALEEHQEDVDRLAVDIANRLTQDRVLRVFDNIEAALYPNSLVPPPVPRKTCSCKGKVRGIPGILPQPVAANRADRIPKMLIIQGLLRSFDSIEYARMLFCDVLNYHYATGEWPCGEWADGTRALLAGEPALLADHNGFKILYMQTSGEGLQRGAERQIIQRLFKDDPTFRGLIVLSDRHQKNWELVNIKVRTDDSSRIILRRMRVGMEAVRTATERLATVEISEAEESSITAEELQARHEKAFDVETVTKAFFLDIANWYFWALKNVRFPKDAPKEKDGRDHVSVIRLITRLIFCWFMKQKRLIPDDLFNERKLADLLVGFAPGKVSNKHSVFYKAILQNLFFATLNTEMDKRAWRRNGQNFMAHSVYRHKSLFTRPDEALALFKNIPFLNGGLFECLDKPLGEKGNPYYVRIDGFSDREDSQPTAPDFLFFGEERELDLSEEYGNKKFKQVKVRGLIHTLSHYHFTVEESTPLEEEVALDPELAGKIFENLLAAYNPETGATARKQTGSFYTPREIVNYMVDEALIAYLKGKLEETCPKAVDIEGRLRRLFSYEEEGHGFTEKEAEHLVAAIDQLKALDPAVGSGAFPMGILHKLVFILGHLDPRNEKWKERQKKRLQDAIAAAERIEDLTIRENTLNELEQHIDGLEEAFEKNTLDYGRKLYLIENSLYGVDIQPIAVQIAKMRFFISLIADQRVDPSADNLGVRPLPNLETKLVAANTLIGIEKPKQMLLRSPRIATLEDELRRVRERHFLAKTTASKKKCRDQDQRLRMEIAEWLTKDGWRKPVAKQLSEWDPYDQNASSGFFDPEWMFGIDYGFNITLGNPPYVRADEQSEWNQRQRQQILASGQYETLWEKWDLYVPFIERSYKLLCSSGVSTLIVSDAFCHSKYAQKPQNWFLKNARILRLDFCNKVKIFDAAVHNVIYLFQRTDGTNSKPERRVHRQTFGKVMLLSTNKQEKLTYRAFFPEDRVVSTFLCTTIELGSVCYISVGMVVHADEKVAKGAFNLDDETSAPFCRG
jgi:adenine-specific DNA-methyltransferase